MNIKNYKIQAPQSRWQDLSEWQEFKVHHVGGEGGVGHGESVYLDAWGFGGVLVVVCGGLRGFGLVLGIFLAECVNHLDKGNIDDKSLSSLFFSVYPVFLFFLGVLRFPNQPPKKFLRLSDFTTHPKFQPKPLLFSLPSPSPYHHPPTPQSHQDRHISRLTDSLDLLALDPGHEGGARVGRIGF